jgi:hypothetical protein
MRAYILVLALCGMAGGAAGAGHANHEYSPVMHASLAATAAAFLALLCWAHLAARRAAAGPRPLPLTVAAAAGRPDLAAAFMAEVLPDLRCMWAGREANQLWRLHTWVRLFASSSEHSLHFYSHLSDVHMVLYSFVHVLCAMLVTTLLYAAAEPDDDYCYEKSLEADCLAPHTVFTIATNR